MTRIIRVIGAMSVAASVGGCWGTVSENPAAQYLRRTDTITTSAGNAKDANAATHAIDPWPPGVNDPRIPANGERMAGAVQRYRGQGQGQRQDSQAGAGQQAAPSSAGATTPMTGGSTSGDRSTLPY
jgi:hypothetical protein